VSCDNSSCSDGCAKKTKKGRFTVCVVCVFFLYTYSRNVWVYALVIDRMTEKNAKEKVKGNDQRI
jgi:transcription elongation factor Elf1